MQLNIKKMVIKKHMPPPFIDGDSIRCISTPNDSLVNVILGKIYTCLAIDSTYEYVVIRGEHGPTELSAKRFEKVPNAT